MNAAGRPGPMVPNGMMMVRQQIHGQMPNGMMMAQMHQQAMQQQPMQQQPMHPNQMQPHPMQQQPPPQGNMGIGHPVLGAPFPLPAPGQLGPRLPQPPQPMPPRSGAKRKMAVASPTDPNEPRAKNPTWTPPVPDAVDARSPLVGDVVCPCVLQVIQMCLCPVSYGPNGRMCRCNPNAPIPVLRISGTSRTFDLMDHKWMVQINELLPASSTDPALQMTLTIHPVSTLPSDAYIKISASMCMINRSAPSRQRHEFKLGSIAYGANSFYNLPVEKQFLTAVVEQPLTSLAVPSNIQIDIELRLEVIEYRNIRNVMKFTYDFRKQTDLSDLVIVCNGEEFYVDCSYLRYYSEYFEITRSEMEMGRMKKHASGLPTVDFGDEIPAAVMEDILLCISPCKKELSAHLLLDVARVADRLMFITVKAEAENQLMKRRRNHFNDLDVLQAAFDFNMESLKDHMLDSVMRNRSGHPAMDLMASLNNPEYQNLSAEVKAALLDRCVTATSNGFPNPCNSGCFPPPGMNPMGQR